MAVSLLVGVRRRVGGGARHGQKNMMNPYQVLGVGRDAGQRDIKMAYRNLAKELHPDRHPGDTGAVERFKEVSAAYQILGDAKTRVRFDRGEIDASGNERMQHQRTYAHAGTGERTRTNSFDNFGFGEFNAEDIISPLFGGRRQGRHTGGRARGSDQRYALEISFMEAAKGGSRRLTLAGGTSVDVTIPAGINDGQIVKLKGKGNPSPAHGPTGDALIEVRVTPHPIFTRYNNDVHVELPVTLQEAVLGARIEVPTIDGPVTMRIPKGSNSGSKLRLKGKGVVNRKTSQRGNQYLTLAIMLPESPDAVLTEFLNDWHPNGYEVRRKLNT